MSPFRFATSVMLSAGLALSFGSANGQSEGRPGVRENSKARETKLSQKGEFNGKEKGER